MPCLRDGLHGDMGPALGGLSMALCLSLPDCSHKATLISPSTLSLRLDSCKDAGITMTHIMVTHLSQRPSAGARVTEWTWLGRAAGGHGYVAVFL